MFTHILVPLDGSANSERALAPAAALARRDGALLHVVTVEEAYPFVIRDDPKWAEILRDQAKAYLRQHTAVLEKSGVRTVIAVLHDNVVEAIRHYASVNAVDLVIMTTHGRTGVSRLWLGSVADALVRSSVTPVLLMRPGTQLPDDALFRRITITTDGSPLSEQAIERAIVLGGVGPDSHYTLVRVVEPVPLIPEIMPYVDVASPYVLPTTLVPDEALTAHATVEATRHTRALADLLLGRHPGIHVEADISVATNVAERLLDRAKMHRSDAIAVATHGRGVSRLVVGSVADKLLRGSDHPVLVYRPVTD